MKSFWQPVNTMVLCFVLCIITIQSVQSEGTAQLAPNASITINGNTTNDVAALHIDNPQFNNFASYNNPEVNSRLHINITDPTSECIYLGFSFGHLNNTSMNPTRQNFEYRILDPNGNVVFGPVVVDASQPHIQNWMEAVSGPMQLNSISGYNADFVSSTDLSSQSWSGPGDYYIEFRNLSGNDPLLIDYWDITVVDCSGATPIEKPGRVWSYNWALFAINDFGFPNRPFNGAFYVCAPDPVDANSAFITQIDFNGSGFRPAAFNVAFNSFGTMNTGNITEDRKSVENMNMTQPEYAIFLNDPIDICRTAQAGTIDILGILGCDGESFCIQYVSSRSGQIDLLLDFHEGDGIFTPGTEDVMITGFVTADEVREELCLDWDGKNGLGDFVFVSAGTEVPIVLSFAQGIYHFPIYDAELMTEGFNIRAVRPGGNDPLLYYDDSNISVASGSGESPVQLAGCNLPCHRWTNYTNPGTVGFGNLNTINSWWFSQQVRSEQTYLLPAYYTCEIQGDKSICEGDTTMLVATYEIKPDDTFPLDIESRVWFLDGNVIAEDTDTIDISSSGQYSFELEWSAIAGDSCSVSCVFDVEEFDVPVTVIDTSILFGDTLVVNSEEYTIRGTYTQTLLAENGCDSIITIILGIIDPVYTCEIIGEPSICFGDTTTLEVITTLDPPDATPLPIRRIEWSGPGITGQVTGNSLEAFREGEYVAVVVYTGSDGILEFTECSFELDLRPRFATSIDTLITEGDTLDINGTLITESGSFVETYTAQNGCDSIVTINVISQNAVVFYDFEDCRSTDYSNFKADYPNPLICGDLSASNVYRNNPQVNAHSCTPGAEGGVAICVSSLDDCNYVAGDDKSILFDLVVQPSPDSVIQITSINFFERAPEEFVWIVGTTGPNNYPLRYGIRVLKNGTEVYRQEDIATTTDWTREIFNFVGNDAFIVDVPSHFRFELLPYCLAGNESDVTAWDIDELSIQAKCGLDEQNMSVVSGKIETVSGEAFENLEVRLTHISDDASVRSSRTDQSGVYAFEHVIRGEDYMISTSNDENHLMGVSTRDIIFIQRHILGLEALETAYQMIAADVDNSNSVTVTDIVALKKLILGIEDSFPNNESWRFVDARQVMSPDNFWDMRTELYLHSIDKDMPKQNLTAIKTGDVTMDQSMFDRKSTENRDVLIAQTENVLVKAGETRTIQYMLTELADAVSGVQLYLNLEGLEVNTVRLKADGVLLDSDYHFDSEVLSVVYADMAGNPYAKELVIEFDIVAHTSGLLSELITIDNKAGHSEVYTGTMANPNNIRLEYGDIRIAGELFEASAIPNPFADNLSLYINGMEEGELSIKLTDLSGRMIYTTSRYLQSGSNMIDLELEGNNIPKGLLICELRCKKDRKILKLMHY